ncbi:hydroxymethylpyrimidine ABC transporter [Vibrio ishigakensis]|uniref:Hydroxymethylpyrimidine ABC transporter n=1 Tax=Vibrio ishigakensis TaxID=1481914 RepID=A0A0B8NXC7_9VIBR|nr:hydroxymethylpyrimidine ABC transporter [Vibrio ishigakensis]
MKLLKSLFATALLMLSGQALAQEKTLTLMLDWFVNPNHGPIIIAQEKGFFAEQGLKVEIQEPADPSVPSKLVAAGRVDMAISYQPNFIIDVEAGLPLVWTGTLLATPLNTLSVLDNGKIKTLSDLKGKTVGVAFLEVMRRSSVRCCKAKALSLATLR